MRCLRGFAAGSGPRSEWEASPYDAATTNPLGQAMDRRLSMLVFGLLCLGVTGCTSSGSFSLFPTGHYLTRPTREVLDASPPVARLPRELEKSVLPGMYLQPGDAVLVEVVDFTSEIRLPADQQVLPDGSLDLAEYGRLVVAGLTPEEAEAQIEERLRAGGAAEGEQVNVRILEPQLVYYVLGEVASPGSFPLAGSETVLDAIVAAGGMTAEASPCDVLLARPTHPNSCRVTLPLCYRQITQLGDTSTNYQLQPGDRIYVGTKGLWEGLAFWRMNSTCSRCRCQGQVACPDPSIADYANPITQLPMTLLGRSAEEEAGDEAESIPAAEPTLAEPQVKRFGPRDRDPAERISAIQGTPGLPPVVTGLIEK